MRSSTVTWQDEDAFRSIHLGLESMGLPGLGLDFDGGIAVRFAIGRFSCVTNPGSALSLCLVGRFPCAVDLDQLGSVIPICRYGTRVIRRLFVRTRDG